MVREQIQFTEEQLRKLKETSKRLDVSVSEVVRRCVDRAAGS